MVCYQLYVGLPRIGNKIGRKIDHDHSINFAFPSMRGACQRKVSIAVLQSRKYAKHDARGYVRTNSLEDVVGHITCDIIYCASGRVRPDDRCACDIERMSRGVTQGVGEIDEHSKSEGFDEDEYPLK